MKISPKITQAMAYIFIIFSCLVVVLPILAILFLIIQRGLPAINLEFLTQMPRMGMKAGGILPAIVGTVYLIIGTLIFSLPLGVLAAIYLVEYAQENLFTRIVKLAIVNLAGIPSIVYGLFGLGLFVIFLQFGTSILSGALTLAIMSIPVVVTASKEALESVPKSFREVSLSLGASKWQTIKHSVLPHALPGIITGTILSLARAAGETAPILFTVAAFYLPRLPRSIFDQVMALPYHLYVIATQVPNMPPKFSYGTALVLLMLVLFLNLWAIMIRTSFRKKKKW